MAYTGDETRVLERRLAEIETTMEGMRQNAPGYEALGREWSTISSTLSSKR